MSTRISSALKLWLMIKGKEQKDLAKVWSCSQSTVTRFLQGKALPEAKTMQRIFLWCLDEEKD